MPHLNQLVEKYGKKGFLAIGVTSEPEGPTKGFMESTSAKMAVAFEPGLKSMKAYGFTGFPSSALVSPKGVVVWTGHPSSLTEKIIEDNLVGVVMNSSGKLTVDVELPKKYSAIVKQLEKGDLGEGMKALDAAIAAQSVSETDKTALEAAKSATQNVLDEETKAVDAAVTEERWHDATLGWKRIATHFKGHEAAKVADTSAADVLKDPAKKKELEAGQRIADAQKAAAAGKKKEALGILDNLGTGYLKDTKEAARAKTVADEIKKDG